MNDSWITCSKMLANDIRTHDQSSYDHEDWLDCLNLHETSWILFAWRDRAMKYDFGWPK